MGCCIFMALIFGLCLAAKSFLFGNTKNKPVEWRLSEKNQAKNYAKTTSNLNDE
jgi:hypothetical protein